MMIKLTQDNNWINKDNRRGLTIDKDILEYELQSYFNWRTPTKRFKTFRQRFFSLGSSEHDKFINHLIDNKGY